jgi:hypothetical protein
MIRHAAWSKVPFRQEKTTIRQTARLRIDNEHAERTRLQDPSSLVGEGWGGGLLHRKARLKSFCNQYFLPTPLPNPTSILFGSKNAPEHHSRKSRAVCRRQRLRASFLRSGRTWGADRIVARRAATNAADRGVEAVACAISRVSSTRRCGPAFLPASQASEGELNHLQRPLRWLPPCPEADQHRASAHL